jgi:hypothetical protein
MAPDRVDGQSALMKAAVVVVTSLLLMSGAALAGREDTIEFNRDLLRQRLEDGRAILPAVVGRLAGIDAV